MYMTIREYRVVPEQADEVARRVDEMWLDQVSKMPGFSTYHVLKPKPDQLVSVMEFLDEETTERAIEASAEWVGERLFDLDVEFLTMYKGPVVVHGGH